MTLAAPIESYDLNTESGVRGFIASEAQKQGVESFIPTEVVRCESQFKIGAIGDSGDALGLAQFHKETFYRMKRLSEQEDMYVYGDERTSIKMLVWALKNRHGGEWTCFRRLSS